MNVTREGDNTFLFQLPATLIDTEEKSIFEATVPHTSNKAGFLILNFGSLQMMNSFGAYMLVKLNVAARKRGQKLLAFGVNSHYRDVLQVTGLDRAIIVFDTKIDALKAAGITYPNTAAEETPDNLLLDLAYWAKPIARLTAPGFPAAAINRNVNGLRAVGPVDGFGQLWQKTYRLTMNKNGLTPETIVSKLKQNLPAFQPAYNHFYPSPAGIKPGEIVAIDSSTPGGPVSTGVMVLYADDVMFTFMTPQGHPESGWVTFSAYEQGGKITAQITGLARANDIVYEAAFRSVGAKMQVNIWKHVLTALAANLGVPANVTVEPVCVDKHMQWPQLGNVWYNAQIRTLLYMPFWGFKKSVKQGKTVGK